MRMLRPHSLKWCATEVTTVWRYKNSIIIIIKRRYIYIKCTYLYLFVTFTSYSCSYELID